jgi:hypothetical protein
MCNQSAKDSMSFVTLVDEVQFTGDSTGLWPMNVATLASGPKDSSLNTMCLPSAWKHVTDGEGKN